MSTKATSIILFFILFTASNCVAQQTHSYDSLNKEFVMINGDTFLLSSVESDARPHGGEDAWSKFLNKNIDYDAPAFNGAPQGKYTVKIEFTVFSDGHLGDFKKLSKWGWGMEESVIRALKKSPAWKPAFKNGQFVDIKKTQVIKYYVHDPW